MQLDTLPATPLVGRADELARIRELSGLAELGDDHDDATRVRGGIVVLSGDAGIGKTRLVTQLAQDARERGWRVLAGHCLGEASTTLPYLPLSEAFSRLDAQEGEVVGELLESTPALTSLVGGAGLAEDAWVDRSDVVAAVHGALEQLGQQRPTLLVVEDLHWADQSSRDLLSLLFVRGFSAPVSVLVTYRSDDLHRRHPLWPTLAQWSRLPQVARVDIGALPDGDVTAIVRRQHPADLEEVAVRSVVERAEGNAFFAEELAAAEAATARGGRSGWRPAGAGVGEDLSRLLLVRFDGLDELGQRITRLASAAGRYVSHGLLERVAAMPPADLDRALRDAVDHNVLLPTESGGYAFRHALLAETVYDDLLPGERVRAHEAYTDVLAAEPELGTWAELARHARLAGRPELALRASVRAADAAMAIGGPEEAFKHLKVALELAREQDDLQSLTLRAATAATAAGRLPKAVALLKERLDSLPNDADPLHRATLLVELAATSRLGDPQTDLTAVTAEALSLLKPDAPAELRARAWSARAHVLSDDNEHEQAVRAADEGLAVAEAEGLREVAGELLTLMARITERRGDSEAAREALEGIVAEARPTGGPVLWRALHHLGYLHHRRGDLALAVRLYREAAEGARGEGLGFAPYPLTARLFAAVAAYEAGDWELVETLTDEGFDPPPPLARALLRSVRLSLSAARGEVEHLTWLPFLRVKRHDDALVALYAAGPEMDLLSQQGDLRGALAAHDDAVRFIRQQWGTPSFQAELRLDTVALGHIASAVAALSSAERAELVARGEALAASAGAVFEASKVKSADGPEAVAWEARRRAEVLRLSWRGGSGEVGFAALAGAWREAVRTFEDYGHVLETARARLRLAEVLRAAGDPEWRPLADQVRDAARSLRARPLLAELSAVTGESNGGSDGGSDGAAPGPQRSAALTPREHEILALAALGRSNRQIGEQLFISTKTASVHMSNILAKLGAASRGEAVSVARDRGLLRS